MQIDSEKVINLIKGFIFIKIKYHNLVKQIILKQKNVSLNYFLALYDIYYILHNMFNFKNNFNYNNLLYLLYKNLIFQKVRLTNLIS